MAKKKKELEELEEEGEGLDDDEDFEDEDDVDEGDEDYDDEDEENDEDEDDEDDEDEDDEDYDEELEDDAAFAAGTEGQADPYWWTPHLVLGLLLLIALLGFFGAFNPWLGHLAPAPAPAGHAAVTTDAQPAPATAAPAPAPPPTAGPLERPQAQEIFGARHILVQFEGVQKAPPTMKRTKEEAKKIATEVAAKAKKTTTAENRAEAWKALAMEHDDPNAEKTGGDLGLFRPGAYDEAFVEAVKKMKVGDVSDPVETPFGYHIIWRTR